MKKHIKVLVATIFFTVGIMISTVTFAQPDPPGIGSGGGNTQMGGGGAPIGSGLIILLTAAAGYGAKKAHKVYNSRKENE